MSGDDERDYAEEAAVRREAVREGLAEQTAERAEQPIDVDAYEAAGVARVEKSQEPDCCANGCQCFDEENEDEDGYHLNSEECDHCPRCCSCVPCMYASVA